MAVRHTATILITAGRIYEDRKPIFSGVCHCHDSTDDDSTYDSSLSEEEGRCNGSPYNPRGLLRQNGWFYDQNRDECRLYYFGDGSWYKDKNKFQTLEECRKTCRSGVPSFCFEKPEEGKRTQSFLMYSYDAKPRSVRRYIGFNRCI
uniref:Putative salivary kunitz domain protein n=1 Tax=Ixodes ricinus TaxID=34613 RepID=A0A0K8RA18_IXORI